MRARPGLCCFVGLYLGVASGQAQQPATEASPVPRFHAREQSVSKRPYATPSQLAVTHVSLYKNGIGFFEHTAHVSGSETVKLDLTSAQLDDVLQTLTAIDLGGGTVTGAGYNSTTPLEQQLRALPLSLGNEPTQEAFYNSLRGARVEVGGSGPTFSGRILALENRPEAEADSANKPVHERRVLTVVAESGATRTLELTPVTVVRLLDTALRADLNTYLELLDSNRSEGVRHLSLTDHGRGSARAACLVSFRGARVEVPPIVSWSRTGLRLRPAPRK